VENNLHREFADPDSLAKAFDILSRADLFRQRVSEQQNWRFKLYMIDTLAGISLAGEPSASFTQYRPPERFAMLYRLKRKGAEMSSLFGKLVPYTHSSVKVIKNHYLPYLKIILSGKKKDDGGGIELNEEEVKLILNS
jgi:replication factor C large subunit